MSFDRRALGLAVALLLAALQLGAVLAVPLRYNAGDTFDDALFLQQAMHLARGEWLGPYSPLTLAKGPGFPIWLAAVHHLGLPVNLAAGLGWLAACALVAVALRPLWPSPVPRLVLFAVVLITPEAFGDFGLLRDLIYPSLLLALVGAGLGLALRALLERRAPVPWALALGLLAAALLLTREEGVVVAPLGVVVAVAVLLRVRWPAALASLALAAAAALLPLAAVATKNERHYGVYTLVETHSRPFTAAYGALTRVRHRGTLPQVPVPRETWAALAAASPAWAELKPQLEGGAGARWQGPSLASIGPALEADDALRQWLAGQIGQPLPRFEPGTAVAHFQQRWAADAAFRGDFARFMGGVRHAEAFLSGEMRSEIGGAFFIWALRDAAAAAGHHRDAQSARRFYKRLAAEVNQACTQGRLDCRRARVGLAPPLIRAHRESLPLAFGTATWALLRSQNHSTASSLTALGDPAAVAAAARFVHARLAPPGTAFGPVQPLEALIGAWRWALPPLAALALALWLAAAPRLWLGRAGPPSPDAEADASTAGLRAGWLAAGLVLLLVLARLAMVSLIHVSGWPAAIAIRYLAPAQPLLLLFVALVLVPVAARRWRRRAG